MTYSQTIEWMFAQLPMYQRQGSVAFKKDLTNSLLLAEALNNPHKKFKSIHVAGTNGKGSTSHMIASVLQEAGYKVGLYTSPHLKDFRERIKINGQMMPQQDVVDFIAEQKSFFEAQKVSFFEMTVGMAFYYFAKEQVDIAVIEVGLGGRLDSTNIITPEVSVITNIGLDHTQFLGTTLPEIASEKAGIIKNNIPVIVGEYQEEVMDVFISKSKELNAPLTLATSVVNEDYSSDLSGSYQKNNCITAVATIKELSNHGFEISEAVLRNGLLKVVENTQLLGRWQEIHNNPKAICDTGHNREGLTYVMQQLSEEIYERLHLVLGVVNDKELEGVLPMFPKEASYYFCRPNIPRGLDAEVLQKKAAQFDLMGSNYNSVQEAFEAALLHANENDLIFVGGSTFVVAEVV